MLKRIALYLAVILGVALVFLGFLWFQVRRERAEMVKSTQAFLSQQTDQKNAFDALGDIDLSLSNLDLQKLEEKLHKPSEQKRESDNSTRLGWSCGAGHCAVSASFLVPYGQEVSPNIPPASLLVSAPFLGSVHHVSIGGIYLGQRVDEMKSLCEQRGYGASLGFNRIRFDKQWNVVWGEINGQINLLLFIDSKAIKNWKESRDAGSAGERPAGIANAK
jgi:hypothetical protein